MIFLFSLVVFMAVAALVPVARRRALAADFVDRPGGRKKHEAAVPPIGGLVVFPVFIFAVLVSGVDAHTVWFLAALALLLITGALDDRRHVPPRIKFAVQWIAAFMIVFPGGATVTGLGDLFGFGPLWLGGGGAIFAVVATVLLINAVNLMDGLDGLAGGIGFIVLFWLALCGAGAPVLLLMSALAGFLVYNMRYPGHGRASIFMGDAGSMALGLSLAWFVINFSQGSGALISPVAVAWLLALPIYDTCGQFARRVREGRHPFDPDHDHFHHHFLYAGFTQGQATAVILSLSFFCGMAGIGGTAFGLPDAVLAYVWTAFLFVHIFMSMKPQRFRRALQKITRKNVE